jgi:CBS domain-containing protein
MNVRTILSGKGDAVVTVAQTQTLAESVELLAQHRIGALVVSGDGRAVEGIVSERDVVRVLSSHGLEALQRSVGSAMSTDVVTCGVDDGIERLMVVMTARRIRHLPVLDDAGVLAGIISIGDVVKMRMGELEAENRALYDYITHGR